MGNEEFGQKIRELRIQKKISLRKMADMVGISPAYMSRIESGRELPPRGEHIVRMAEILEVPADELLMLAGKVDPSIQEYIRTTTSIPEFLRTAKEENLTSDEFRKLTDQIKKDRG